jgi:hypothetical protein
MNQLSILSPVFAMVALTALVWFTMVVQRFSLGKRLKLEMSSFQSRSTAAQAYGQGDKAGNHLMNLFEIPVLFYALASLLIATQHVTPTLVNMAWGFVVLRAVHALIHCTVNKVELRGLVYMLSTLVIFAMWVMFAMSVYATAPAL